MSKALVDVSDPLPPQGRTAPAPRSNRARRLPLIAAFATLVVAAACSADGGGSAVVPGGAPGKTASNVAGALPATSPTPAAANLAGCAVTDGTASCGVLQNTNYKASGSPQGGFTAAQLRSAYGLPSSSGAAGTGPLVAVVDAYDDANAENDMNAYRTAFGLPACTSADRCFRKVVSSGKVTAPGQIKKLIGTVLGTTWNDEIALDLAMVSASCPTCKVMLVEVGGNDLDTLANGVTIAAGYQPAAISASWGVPEAGNASGIDAGAQAAFDQPGIAITASAGDGGAVQFPASSPYVTAVGGTTLTQGGGARGWAESAWASSGNGCSTIFAQPAWQPSASGCAGRSVPDVSVVADYNTGVDVYSTAQGGWVVLGGTSVGAPFVAGLYAAAADYGAATTGAPAIYAQIAGLNAVSGGGVSPKGLAGF